MLTTKSDHAVVHPATSSTHSYLPNEECFQYVHGVAKKGLRSLLYAYRYIYQVKYAPLEGDPIKKLPVISPNVKHPASKLETNSSEIQS